jgi:putative peptide zinc metalloprotease protein
MERGPTVELERRKQLKLRVRADLATAPQRYEGRTYYIVKDPVSLRYYRYSEQEQFLLSRMDGRRTLDEIRLDFEKEFRPDRLDLPDLESFAQQLLMIGLAHPESPQADRQLYKRRQQHHRTQLLQLLTNILYIPVPICDPDRLLGRMVRPLRWIFTTPFMLLSVGVILGALLLVATHFETFLARLPASHEFLNWKTVVYLWAVYGVVKVIHEFGHGLSCKVFGGEVHQMGLLFLCLAPCLYCDVSDAWTLPSKWRRIVISFAGIYVELIIAALATFVWWNTPAQPFLNGLCLYLMVVCSVSTVVFNGNPLMRYDGYYILADWLEIPNLRVRAAQFLKDLVRESCLGMRVPPGPYMTAGRRVLFVVYVVASYLYGWVVTFAILWMLSNFLKPYGLRAVSNLLACAAAGSMVGWPLYGLVKGLRQRGRLPEMKPLRVYLSLAGLTGLAALLLLLPLPVARVYQVALVQLRPGAAEKVFLATPGTLERLHVRDGQRVEKGDVLAEFRSLKVENQLEQARSEHDIRVVEVQSLVAESLRAATAAERAKIEAALAEARAERDRTAREIEVYEQVTRALVLRAPRAGLVMGAPRIDQVGKLWEKEDTTAFCTIGDPARPEALMPVSPAEYRLLKEELAGGRDVPVTIRVEGGDLRVWKGRLARLPEAEAHDVPFQLTLKGGGPLAVRPGTAPHTFVPQGQQYLLGVDFLESDDAVCPGTMAQVMVHCRWRTCGWWLWRKIAATFDVELL